MATQWQWSLRTWVVWMPIAVAVVLASAAPELQKVEGLEAAWFWQSVWVSSPAALAAGATMRVKFPEYLIAFWVVVGAASIVLWVGLDCIEYAFYWETLHEFLAGIGDTLLINQFLSVRASIAATAIGGLLALWIFPAKVQS